MIFCWLTGLVFPAATGDPSALYQHLAGYHVLQAPHVASARGAPAPFSMRYTHTRHWCNNSKQTPKTIT